MPNTEIELLLACLRPGREPGADAPTAGTPAIDWDRFATLATNHHVIPLVYRALKSDPRFPSAIRERFRRDRLQIAAHSLRAAHVLCRLQRKAAAEGIELLPVKGPSLALLAYGRESLRQFEDLDLVVRQTDLLRTVAWFESEGYAPHSLLTSAKARRRYLATRQDWKLSKPNDPLLLEIKPNPIWHTLSGAESVDFLSRSVVSLPLDGRAVLRVPGPEAQLLMVCMDGAKDMWCKFAAVADVGHLLARHPEADWTGLLKDAARLGQRRTLLVGLRVVEILLRCPLPSVFREAAEKDRMVKRQALRAARYLRTDIKHPTIGRCCVFAFRVRDSWRDRARFAFRLLTVPSLVEWHRTPLPPSLFVLYAVIRPVRLAWDVLTRRPPRRLNKRAGAGAGGRAEG